MKQKFFIFFFFVFLVGPFNTYADHDECFEVREYGYKIIIGKPLPTHWFKVGNMQLNDSQLHVSLKTSYPEYYTSGIDSEGFTIDHFCGYKNGIYMNISNGDFGPNVEFSEDAPKCYSCKTVNEEMPYFISGTGLKIGQDKNNVSSLLGYEIANDVTSIMFEEIEKSENHNIWHSQVLRIEFRNNTLFRFSIDDSREIYN